ncbi:MAG: hypothetical protein D6698_04390, partial [Gammaproteobacteria bacterium]
MSTGEERLWALAQQNADQGDYAQAELVIKDIRAKFGETEKVLFFLGEMARLQGQPSHAEHYYQSCLRLNPLSLPARKMLALLYRQQRG